jgi:hypothetical protein
MHCNWVYGITDLEAKVKLIEFCPKRYKFVGSDAKGRVFGGIPLLVQFMGNGSGVWLLKSIWRSIRDSWSTPIPFGNRSAKINNEIKTNNVPSLCYI